MPDEHALNHGNHVENNYGTIHQHIGYKPLRELPKRVRVALLGGLATLLLGAGGFYAQGAAKSARVYYCASGGHVKYHASAGCPGLSSCTARVASTTLAQVKQRRMAPCHVCH
jgi:hypothetical protein